jgi:hypothetical protein
MADVPDGTLVKARVGITDSNLSWKQYLIGIIAVWADFKLYGYTIAAYAAEKAALEAGSTAWYYNLPYGHLYQIYIAVGVILTLVTYALIRSELAFYRGWNFLVFLYRWIRKSDFIYKHDEKTTPDKKLDEHVKLQRMLSDSGTAFFSKCKTYKDNVCNTGMLLVVSPELIGSFEDFHEVMSILLYSIKSGRIQKLHAIQSQDMRDLAAKYEKLLQLPPDKLPPAERVGLFYTKQFLQNLSGRVNWAYFVFVGLGYYIDDKEAILETERAKESFEHFLGMAGIESRLITSQYEYQLVYRQLSNMRQLGVVTV